MDKQTWTKGNAQYVKAIFPPTTAQMIVKQAENAVKNPEVSGVARSLVSGLIDENQSAFFALMSEIQAIYNLIFSKIRYTRDPHGVELVYGAEFLVGKWKNGEKWSDDCDTYASVLMTFFLSIGRHARVTIVSFSKEHPQRYEHVFVEVYCPPEPSRGIPGRWLVVDPSTAPHTRKMLSKVVHKAHFYPS